MFSKIIVGVDGSEPAQHAVRLACDLAKKYDSELHMVHTPKPETVAFALGAVSGYHVATTMPKPEDIEAAAEKIVTTAQDIAHEYGLDAVNHIGDGDPADDVVAFANDTGADLIVTGRRGLGQVAGALMGSTSQRVSKNARCAHLTVA
ncbi:MAG: universal stress protein [Pseudomonadota bacterium]